MNGAGSEEIPAFLDKIVNFPDGNTFQIIRPLTNYRSCHDGVPAEARMVFICTRKTEAASKEMLEEYVMKVKVQIPDENRANSQSAQKGPSDTTAAELKALEKFRKANNPSVPHLVVAKHAVQGQDSSFPMPGGYITYTVMTKMPGHELFGKYWNMDSKERDLISDEFMKALKSIYDLGIEPQDRALRNILWEAETKKCSIIDFEIYGETTEQVRDRLKELQRWGLARRPPPRDWWFEWREQER